VWFISCAIGVVALTAFGLVDVRTPALFTAFMILLHVGTLGLAFCFWSMLPDTVEYGEWRTGVRAEAFIFGLAGFFAKIALGIGTGLFSVALGVIGYKANIVQTPETLAGLKATIVFLPMAGFVLGAVAILFSPLTMGRHEAIVTELAERRAVEIL
jgi:GPH family glycoside/pentoside/hexuronide:cation symporter